MEIGCGFPSSGLNKHDAARRGHAQNIRKPKRISSYERAWNAGLNIPARPSIGFQGFHGCAGGGEGFAAFDFH